MKKFRLTEENQLGDIVETHITDIESTSLRGAKTKSVNYLVKSVEEKKWYDGQSIDIRRYKNGMWVDKLDGSSERIVHVNKVVKLVEITEEDDNTPEDDKSSGVNTSESLTSFKKGEKVRHIDGREGVVQRTPKNDESYHVITFTDGDVRSVHFNKLELVNDKGRIRVEVTYYDKSTTEATGIYLNNNFDYQKAVSDKKADLLYIEFDDGKVLFRKDFDGNDLFKNEGIIEVNHGCILFYDYKDDVKTHTEGLDYIQIENTYPRGRLINIKGRTYIVIGYGSAMFSGKDTDMSLCVKDYITDNKKFFETSEISPDMLLPQ